MERHIDKCGNFLHEKFSFLDNFKNFNTLLFVVLNNTNNIYYAFIKNKDIIYLININSSFSFQEYISIDELKNYLINNIDLDNKNIYKILSSLNIYEYDMLNIINEWLNNVELNKYRKYNMKPIKNK